jgi:hypothetical protein
MCNCLIQFLITMDLSIEHVFYKCTATLRNHHIYDGWFKRRIEGIGVYIHSFLTLALEGGGWFQYPAVLRFGKNPVTHWIGGRVWPRADLNALERGNAWFETRWDTDCPELYVVYVSTSIKCRNITPIRRWLLPSESFPIHHSHTGVRDSEVSWSSRFDFRWSNWGLIDLIVPDAICPAVSSGG